MQGRTTGPLDRFFSSLSILNLIPTYTISFGRLQNFAVPVKLKFREVHAQELMDAVEEIHNLFWKAKGREVPWIRAS